MGATQKVTLNIDHTYDNHHSYGKGAKTPGAKKDLFPERMTKEEINKSVLRAFRKKQKIGRRQPNYKGENRQQFIGYDHKTGLTIVFWYNHTTQMIETAWPDWQHKYEHRNQAKDGR
jgi:hypothetical protein